MNEEATMYLDLSKESMDSTIKHLETTLSHIRAGKANVHILDDIRVPYYGNNVPLSQCASVSTPDARSIVILPWEKNLLKDIEKAIIDSSVGIMPENNGEMIRLGIPPLTEERRKTLVKEVRTNGENAKISIRNARREAIDEIKKLVKNGLAEDMGKDAEASAQQLHDKYIQQLDKIVVAKEKEIMTV